jgi:hypothetical protein
VNFSHTSAVAPFSVSGATLRSSTVAFDSRSPAITIDGGNIPTSNSGGVGENSLSAQSRCPLKGRRVEVNQSDLMPGLIQLTNYQTTDKSGAEHPDSACSVGVGHGTQTWYSAFENGEAFIRRLSPPQDRDRYGG